MSDDKQTTPKEVEAYKAFQKEHREIVHDFTEKATGLIEEIDKKQAEEIKKEIEKS